ncbi:MAG: hypothetical protein GX456_13150 [Verrucomicrobia bacterium]|nr:hypothetical protein [Verrucomicrobiota bacterium]
MSVPISGRISPMTDPTTRFDPEIARPKIHRLGAAKNRRAPARAGKSNGAGSAAVLGRINPTTDSTTRFDHAHRAAEHTPVGCGEESPRSCTRWKKQRRRERGRPRPHQPDAPILHQFRSSQSGARTLTGWGSTNNVSVPMSACEGFLHRLR